MTNTMAQYAEQKEDKHMARKPMVTRTITVTVCEVMCVDYEKQNFITKHVTLPRTYKDTRKMLDMARTLVKAPLEAVRISDYKVVTQRYGMPEERFVTCADVLEDTDNN